MAIFSIAMLNYQRVIWFDICFASCFWIIPTCSMVLEYLPTTPFLWPSFGAKYSSTMVRIWEWSTYSALLSTVPSRGAIPYRYPFSIGWLINRGVCSPLEQKVHGDKW